MSYYTSNALWGGSILVDLRGGATLECVARARAHAGEGPRGGAALEGWGVV